MVVERDQSGERHPARGKWRPVVLDGENVAQLRCPTCGQTAYLDSVSGHSIDADGFVQPSVVCPTDGCGFHEFVKLGEWAA